MAGTFEVGEHVTFKIKAGPRAGEVQSAKIIAVPPHDRHGRARVVVAYTTPAGNNQQTMRFAADVDKL